MGIRFLTFRALERLALLDFFSYGTYDRFRRLAEGYGKRQTLWPSWIIRRRRHCHQLLT
jgi:hypothetical protein